MLVAILTRTVFCVFYKGWSLIKTWQPLSMANTNSWLWTHPAPLMYIQFSYLFKQSTECDVVYINTWHWFHAHFMRNLWCISFLRAFLANSQKEMKNYFIAYIEAISHERACYSAGYLTVIWSHTQVCITVMIFDTTARLWGQYCFHTTVL